MEDDEKIKSKVNRKLMRIKGKYVYKDPKITNEIIKPIPYTCSKGCDKCGDYQISIVEYIAHYEPVDTTECLFSFITLPGDFFIRFFDESNIRYSIIYNILPEVLDILNRIFIDDISTMIVEFLMPKLLPIYRHRFFNDSIMDAINDYDSGMLNVRRVKFPCPYIHTCD
jgi:hypothetical protein